MKLGLQNKRIAVIGAGIAGLTISKKLASSNEVVIFEKLSEVGGRMATCKSTGFNFDFGAQFFDAKTDEFQKFIHSAKQLGIIKVWKAKFAEIIQKKIVRLWNTSRHYIGNTGIIDLCNYIANSLNIIYEQEIKSISYMNSKWKLISHTNKYYIDFDYLIIAIPSQQLLKLLSNNYYFYKYASKRTMLPCFTLMIQLKSKPNLIYDGAIVKESILSWISTNTNKYASSSGIIVGHSSNIWAQSHIRGDMDQIKQIMKNILLEILDLSSDNAIQSTYLHRWNFANINFLKSDFSHFDQNMQLGVCGDWFRKGKVESAFMSANSLYNKLNLMAVNQNG